MRESAALRDFNAAYVGYGSFTSFKRCARYVRSSPKSGDKADIAGLRIRAITGREQMQQSQCYSITSSARASSASGTVRPSALAVLRLSTVSYLVGACTGRSAGFSPLRMRST
jgi:hypothetical protein